MRRFHSETRTSCTTTTARVWCSSGLNRWPPKHPSTRNIGLLDMTVRGGMYVSKRSPYATHAGMCSSGSAHIWTSPRKSSHHDSWPCCRSSCSNHSSSRPWAALPVALRTTSTICSPSSPARALWCSTTCRMIIHQDATWKMSSLPAPVRQRSPRNCSPTAASRCCNRASST